MNNKRYIVQNLNFAAPYPGNLMWSLWNLEQTCKRENIEIIYCFPETAKNIPWIKEMKEQGNIVFFKPIERGVLFWRKLINQYSPVAIHTHFWNIRDSITIKLARVFNRRMRLILHHHNTYFASKNRWKELLKRMIIKSNINIACGVALGKRLQKQNFKNVITVENAIDYSRLDVYAPLNRQDFDISTEAKVLLMFGHELHRKGVDIAIKAIESLGSEREIVLCIVVARNLVEAKKKLNAEIGEIPKWIRFLPPRDDIATYYRFADVFLSPSREEGFCYALPEAAYSGCQIVFSDIEGQLHAADIPGSVCFESESIASLQKQIAEALDRKLPSAAKEYVCDRYSLSSWSEAMTNIYKKV